MKNIFKKMMLGSALVLCAAGTASANQLLVYLTAGQIVSAVTGSTFSGCAAGLTDCGVFAIGGISASDGGHTALSVSAYTGGSPIPTGTAAWINTTVASLYSGYEIGSSGNGVTQETFITANAHTSGNNCPSSPPTACNYTGNVSSSVNAGTALMNATTQIGFLVDFGSTQISSATTATLSLQLLATEFTSTSNGAQFVKSVTGAPVSISSTNTVALPEPSSIALMLSGVGAIGYGSWRRRKMLAVPQNLQ